MTTCQLPQTIPSLNFQPTEVFLVASGDSRLPANQICWPAQAEMEQRIIATLAAEGVTVKRAHPYNEEMKHGFIWNQRMGMDVFKSIPPQAPLIVAIQAQS